MIKHKYIKSLQRQYGVTLIELMVAMVISLIVLLGVVTVYVSSKRSYQFQESVVEIQENARYAFLQLGNSARSAGYLGCNPRIKNLLNNTVTNYDPALYNLQSGISGWEYVQATGTAPGTTYTINNVPTTGAAAEWSGNAGLGNVALPTILAGKAIQGSDVLILNSTKPLENLIPSPALKTDTSFTVDKPHGLPKGTIVIISDCVRGDMFQTNDNAPASKEFNRPLDAAPAGVAVPSPGNLDPDPTTLNTTFSQDITAGARIQVVRSTAFFIGISPSGEPALFRADFGSGITNVVPVELAEGVENMQILYGEDRTAIAGEFPDDEITRVEQFVTADQIFNPDNVIALRISLLIRTSDDLARNATSTTHIMGATAATGTSLVSPTDSRSRRAFTYTIFMRNKAVYRNKTN